MAAPSKLLDQFVIRLPEGMRDKLKTLADSNGRSMNAEIIARLEQSIERDAAWLEALEHIQDLLARMESVEHDVARHSDDISDLIVRTRR